MMMITHYGSLSQIMRSIQAIYPKFKSIKIHSVIRSRGAWVVKYSHTGETL